MSTLRPGSRRSRKPSPGMSSWDLTLLAVGCGVLLAAYVFRERLLEDMLALTAAINFALREFLGLGPQLDALERFVRGSAARQPAYTRAAVDDDE